MKFRLTFKNPDILDILYDSFSVKEQIAEEMENFVRKFLRFGELLDVEFDTDANTAEVVRQK